jgi:hypothetical protein
MPNSCAGSPRSFPSSLPWSAAGGRPLPRHASHDERDRAGTVAGRTTTLAALLLSLARFGAKRLENPVENCPLRPLVRRAEAGNLLPSLHGRVLVDKPDARVKAYITVILKKNKSLNELAVKAAVRKGLKLGRKPIGAGVIREVRRTGSTAPGPLPMPGTSWRRTRPSRRRRS